MAVLFSFQEIFLKQNNSVNFAFTHFLAVNQLCTCSSLCNIFFKENVRYPVWTWKISN